MDIVIWKKIRFEIGIGAKLTAGVAQEEFGVFFVSEAISGNVFRSQLNSLLQCGFPIAHRFDREDQT